jgi:hypothetical protein
MVNGFYGKRRCGISEEVQIFQYVPLATYAAMII